VALILDRAKALGFNMIETYIPWSIHEVHPSLDWGQEDPRKTRKTHAAVRGKRIVGLLVRSRPADQRRIGRTLAFPNGSCSS